MSHNSRKGVFLWHSKDFMSETVYSRAVLSAFQDQLEARIANPQLQLKTIERRMRQLPSDETNGFNQLLAVLLQGLCIKFDEREYVTQMDELVTTPTGGLVKRLSRSVDKKTRNPKSTRGTIWRRNSTVKERRCQLPNWRSGTTAQLEAKRKSVVKLIPKEVWLAEKETQAQTEKQIMLVGIRNKQEKRTQKQALIAEYEKRMELLKSEQEQCAEAVMVVLTRLAEKQGLAQKPKIFSRILSSLENNRPLPLLFVWGPPYEQQGFNQNLFSSNTPEEKMANEIESFFSELLSLGLNLQPILLFADVYGTKINGLNCEEVDAYYQQLKSRFNYALVTQWSEIIAANQQRYNQLEQQAVEEIVVPEKAVANAQIVQAKLGSQINLQEARKLATMYVKERIIEGLLLEEGFILRDQKITNCIKLGTAPTRFRNDEPYETDLPRIYIKNMTRAAWNAAR